MIRYSLIIETMETVPNYEIVQKLGVAADEVKKCVTGSHKVTASLMVDLKANIDG